MNLLDSVISWVAPEAGFKRVRARAMLGALLAYEGANAGRRTSGWITSGTSANSEVGGAIEKLRARSRDLVRNNPYAARAIDELVAQVIGTGITAQARAETEEENRTIDSAWDTWMEECDAEGQLDFHGIQELATRTMFESGECLIRLRPRFAEDGLTVPLQLQVLEPDFLDHRKTEKLDGGYIIQGVEFDLLGRRRAYWIFAEHPGDVISTSLLGNSASRRVPADQIIHVYRKRRTQVRGVPVLAPVMLALRDLDGYLDATRVRNQIEACMTAFISPPEGEQSDSLGQLSTDEDGQRQERFRPGMIMYGQPGEKAEFFAPTASQGSAEFVRGSERNIAIGVGLTYEQLTGDLSNVNYSSYRAGLLSFQASVEQLRWLCLVPSMLRPIRRRFIEAAFVAGRIPNLTYATEYTPPAFGSVDPLKDAEAAETDLRIGRRTWAQVVAELGYDPRNQISEIKKWKPELEEAGVSFTSKGATSNAQENSQGQPAGAAAAR